ncbi:FUSC family protein [Shewanella sp. cp20]|uniref:FUSC family protein n=1 Tax=Shewanella sp. cp20 TaxID=1521167 RepID=UPI00059F6E49|nr:FUSC family protein [Shewanella sp. cp20]KIO37899.1 hypothetical protein DB48_03300 [Shewanella sp. cp20]
MLSSSIKEAIKVSLAVTLALALALWFQWEKPYWAAITVIAISASESFGHGLRQGKLRLLGTLAGICYALLLIGLFSQERLLFIVFFHLFLGFCVFFGDNKRYGYAFTMSFAVFAIVAMMGGSNGTASFDIAILRIQETLLGVLAYSVVFRFLWPTTTESLFFDTLETVTKQFRQAQKHLSQALADGQRLDTQAAYLDNQHHIDRLDELLALSVLLRHEKAKWQSIVGACDGIQAHLSRLVSEIDKQESAQSPDGQPVPLSPQQLGPEPLSPEQQVSEQIIQEQASLEPLSLEQLSNELKQLEAAIREDQSKCQALADYWAKQRPAIVADKAPRYKALKPRLTNALTAMAISSTCFGLWIYFAIPGGPIFPLIGAALANAAVYLPSSLIRPAKMACLAWGALFLAEYCLILTQMTELWQLLAFYGINMLLIYGCFNKPSHAVIRLLGGNLLLIMTMNALHGTPQYEIVTPILMLVIVLIGLTVTRFYMRLLKEKPL